MRVLIENADIKLAYTEKHDIPFIMETEQEQENAKYVGQWSYEQHVIALHHNDILHLVIKDANEQGIGYAIIKGLKNNNDSIELMRIAITKKGCGYGKTALSLIKKWCFEIKFAHRLWLDVREHNIRALHVYETQGFIREGTLRECVKVENEYQSLTVMSILSQDYREK